MNTPISIIIADDHAVVREGLRAFMSTQQNIKVVGEAENGREALDMTLFKKPDVLLLDLVMPKMGGVEAITAIKQYDGIHTRILVLTSFDDDTNVFAAIKAGATGYLLKDSSPVELVRAIENVHQGITTLHPTIALKVIREMESPNETLPPTQVPLTEREAEVLRHVAKGLTNQDIAAQIHLSERTIGKHVGNILAKLHLANRTQAALYALREGYAEL